MITKERYELAKRIVVEYDELFGDSAPNQVNYDVAKSVVKEYDQIKKIMNSKWLTNSVKSFALSIYYYWNWLSFHY